MNSTASHNPRNCTTSSNYKGNYRFTGKTYFFEDRVKHNTNACHITTIFQKSNQEVHNHYQRQEANHCTYAANDAIQQNCLGQRRSSFYHSSNIFLETFNPSHQSISQVRAKARLRNIKNQEHNSCKNRQA